jgi:hypothetical protein
LRDDVFDWSGLDVTRLPSQVLAAQFIASPVTASRLS